MVSFCFLLCCFYNLPVLLTHLAQSRMTVLVFNVQFHQTNILQWISEKFSCYLIYGWIPLLHVCHRNYYYYLKRKEKKSTCLSRVYPFLKGIHGISLFPPTPPTPTTMPIPWGGAWAGCNGSNMTLTIQSLCMKWLQATKGKNVEQVLKV